MLGKIFVSLFAAVLLSVEILIGVDGEKGELYPDGSLRRRYRPYINGLILPIYVTSFSLFYVAMDGWRDAGIRLLGHMVQIAVIMMVYYGVLLLVLPLLRKMISARVCSTLWLIPTMLNITLLDASWWEENAPEFVLTLPKGWVGWLALLWAVGAVAVLGWNVLIHLSFRREILTDARPVTEENVLRIWQEEREQAGLRKDYPLLWSPRVKTPMSVGMGEKKIRVILPETDYTDEELSMLLRHELVHICRRDGENKFFLTFCKALCWFNPLIWIAMRKSADDIELSCDETVMAEADGVRRRKYADLLLTAAGEERGFTTCLSANAKAMRYRLKNVVQDRPRRLGAVLAGVLTFMLLMSAGSTALAYDPGAGAEYIFENSPEAGQIEYVWLWEMGARGAASSVHYECTEPEELLEYLAGLSMSRMLKGCDLSEQEGVAEIELQNRIIRIRDRVLTVDDPHGVRLDREVYWLEEPVDMELIRSCLTAGE